MLALQHTKSFEYTSITALGIDLTNLLIQRKPVIRILSGVGENILITVCSYNRYVLITDMFLYPICSYNRYVLITDMFLYPICSYNRYVLITDMFLYPICSYNRYVLISDIHYIIYNPVVKDRRAIQRLNYREINEGVSVSLFIYDKLYFAEKY